MAKFKKGDKVVFVGGSDLGVWAEEVFKIQKRGKGYFVVITCCKDDISIDENPHAYALVPKWFELYEEEIVELEYRDGASVDESEDRIDVNCPSTGDYVAIIFDAGVKISTIGGNLDTKEAVDNFIIALLRARKKVFGED